MRTLVAQERAHEIARADGRGAAAGRRGRRGAPGGSRRSDGRQSRRRVVQRWRRRRRRRRRRGAGQGLPGGRAAAPPFTPPARLRGGTRSATRQARERKKSVAIDHSRLRGADVAAPSPERKAKRWRWGQGGGGVRAEEPHAAPRLRATRAGRARWRSKTSSLGSSRWRGTSHLSSFRHLLALVDTNSNEQIDYHEFSRAFRRRRPSTSTREVELCCVFFAHEMERSRRVLVTHFESHAAAQVKVEAVRKLVAPFAHEIDGDLADLYMQMEALTEGGADDGAGADAFASVLISHGVHSLRSPFFRDATGGVRLSRALANHSFAAKFAQKLKDGASESPPAPSSRRAAGSMRGAHRDNLRLDYYPLRVGLISPHEATAQTNGSTRRVLQRQQRPRVRVSAAASAASSPPPHPPPHERDHARRRSKRLRSSRRAGDARCRGPTSRRDAVGIDQIGAEVAHPRSARARARRQQQPMRAASFASVS